MEDASGTPRQKLPLVEINQIVNEFRSRYGALFDREMAAEIYRHRQPFTTKELAQEILLWLERDIPETVIRSLRVVLSRYIQTGEYVDDMTLLLGEQVPLLSAQRFAKQIDDLVRANRALQEQVDRTAQETPTVATKE